MGYAKMMNRVRGDLEENPLKAGELVRLKSGGRVMVIADVEADGSVAVQWQDRGGVERATLYRGEILRRVGRSFFGIGR